MQRYYQPAPIATGYILKDEFWVVQPVGTTNLVTNPSMELGLDGYAALNSTISQEIDQQRRGAYSTLVTPSSALQAGGVYFDVDVQLGVSYTFSVDLLGTKNAEYKLIVSDPSASILGILPGMWSSWGWYGGPTFPTESSLQNT